MTTRDMTFRGTRAGSPVVSTYHLDFIEQVGTRSPQDYYHFTNGMVATETRSGWIVWRKVRNFWGEDKLREWITQATMEVVQ